MKQIIDSKQFSVQEIEKSDFDIFLESEYKNTHPETLIKQTFPSNVMDIISNDHHKLKDGGFIISYDFYEHKWYVAHEGYIREAEGEGKSFLEAAQNYLTKIKKENAKVIYESISEEVNKHLSDNISCELEDDALTIKDYSKGIDHISTIAFRKIKGKSIEEIIVIANEILNEKF